MKRQTATLPIGTNRPELPPNVKPSALGAPALDLYRWYTIRHSLALLMNKLVNEENPDNVEELERQRIEECIYTQNLQARIAKIIDAEEKRLGVTPIKE